MDWIDLVVQDVAELSDRDSPDDWPEAMLVTGDELRSIIGSRAPAEIERLRDALRMIESQAVLIGVNECSRLAKDALMPNVKLTGSAHNEKGQDK